MFYPSHPAERGALLGPVPVQPAEDNREAVFAVLQFPLHRVHSGVPAADQRAHHPAVVGLTADALQPDGVPNQLRYGLHPDPAGQRLHLLRRIIQADPHPRIPLH